MMMLSLHNLSKEYGMLPSEALSRATTFDFKVLDTATKWEIRNRNKESGKPQAVTTEDYSQEDLIALLNKSKAAQC